MIRMTKESTASRRPRHAAATHKTDVEEVIVLLAVDHFPDEEVYKPRPVMLIDSGRRRPVSPTKPVIIVGEATTGGVRVAKARVRPIIKDRIHRRVKGLVIDDAHQLFDIRDPPVVVAGVSDAAFAVQQHHLIPDRHIIETHCDPEEVWTRPPIPSAVVMGATST